MNIQVYYIPLLLCVLRLTPIPQNNKTSPIFIFSHGLGEDRTQGILYTSAHGHHNATLPEDYYGWDRANAMCSHYPLWTKIQRFCKSTFGQDCGSAMIKGIEDSQLNNHKKFIHGLSEGAAIVVMALASKKISHVAACVLECPFANIDTVFTNLPLINYIAGQSIVMKQLAHCLFYQYHPDEQQPIDVINNISEETAILFIHSEQDELIDVAHSCVLYMVLKSQGRKNTYLLITKQGNHPNAIRSNNNAQELVRAFWKKYGCNLSFHKLPDTTFNLDATDSEGNLIYQPSIEQVKAYLAQRKLYQFIRYACTKSITGLGITYLWYKAFMT